ncbi:hypothetical protein OFO99_38265, partial [Escherichia coli]|nr:hypothetical protein [Escherichia coli]
ETITKPFFNRCAQRLVIKVSDEGVTPCKWLNWINYLREKVETKPQHQSNQWRCRLDLKSMILTLEAVV